MVNVGTSVITTPFMAAVLVLIYFDLRVRKEGFDLELLSQGVGVPGAPPAGGPWTAPGGYPGGGWAPPGGGWAPPGTGWPAPAGPAPPPAPPAGGPPAGGWDAPIDPTGPGPGAE